MSKRSLGDAEVEATLPRKKSKKDKKDKKDRKEKLREAESESTTPLHSEEVAVSELDGERTKKKKDKKAKKEKKARTGEDANGEEVAPAEEEVQDEEKVKKDKKDKKDKKAKKEKKEKKEKKKQQQRDDDSSDPKSASNQTANGHAESNAAADAAADAVASTTTNGAVNSSSSLTTSPQIYEQSASLASVPETEVAAFLNKHEITVTDPLSKKTLRPIMQFTQLPTSALIAKKPFAAFDAPTPIQAASWPFGLSGRDIVGVAETGSGKTIAFGLPLINAVLGMSNPAAAANKKGKSGGGVRAVVVSPTRELAMQTSEQLARLGGLVGLRTVCVYGGASKDEQRAQLRRADVIVATPGRLNDFLDEGAARLDGARFVVLDEADRMLDTGFEDDIRRILGHAPPREARQTLMFTATWPQSVQALAATFTVSPVRIQIGGRGGGGADGELQANARIAQRVEVVDQHAKEGRLLEILRAQPRGERVLVFCLYKKEAARVEETLRRRGGLRVVGIHGDMKQEQRTRSLDAFKTGQTPVLVATDVAARGLDIPEVKLVVNVTFPLTIEDYVHRIGRTGRAGKTGEAITLFTEHDKPHSGELVNILKQAGQPVPEDLLKFGTTVKKKAHGAYGAFFKDVDMSKKGTKITFDD
ncbi:DEAD-domain-containing protein [Xylariaceae sp. FL0804]|nr:DEAD-domain-containing protein [Xylariaceae sp. FL0804]